MSDKSAKKRYMPLGVFIMVVAVIIWSISALFWMFFYQDLQPVFYTKADGLYYVAGENKAPQKLEQGIGKFIEVTKNGRSIFYVDEYANLYQAKTASGKSQKIAESIDTIGISSDSKYLYAMEWNAETAERSLVKYKIGFWGLSARREVESGISPYSMKIYGKNVVFLKNEGEDILLMLHNGTDTEQIAKNGYVLTYQKNILYIMDNYDGATGTLKTYEKGKLREIDTFIQGLSTFRAIDDSIYYFKDNNLYTLQGTKPKLIATEVQGIIESSQIK